MASPPLALAQSPPHCWSELSVDLMQLIFERLGFADFERAKSVCSSWLSDDQTKDYLVIGEDLVYCKKGDNSWKQFSEGIQDQEDMVFKDHKLYCLAYDALRIFDFSGEFPVQVSRVSVGGLMRLHGIPPHVQEVRMRNSVVVTVRGDVLIVKSECPFMSETWSFKIFKTDSSKGLEEIFFFGRWGDYFGFGYYSAC
ncbi:hypothetical protein DY000_02027038 [Brassica cretica]|uniref:KIB1-4 beta-propeller domain-containing protein n=1 Tax=Brassica cretica TaxID=69181 RepID=A0ABQ7EG86_BRACR|nr:hypothetical protein DY000_02027038 [Brassica cretica]